MPAEVRQQIRYSKALDALSSRIGICLAIGCVTIICLGAGLYTQTVVQQLQDTEQVFEDRQIRNGYVATSDVQRLILVAQQASQAGEVTAEMDARFRDAADFVYVRTDHLKTILKNDAGFASGRAAIDALEVIVAIADRTIAEDYADLPQRVDELLIAAETARKNLVQYLDDMRRHADKVMLTQSTVVRKQQIIMIGSLVGLTIVGVIALSLLRREVLSRRAREQAEQRIEFLAFYDPLTELPNRVQFQDRLQVLLAGKKQPVALILVDLDEFKAVNDTYGHAAGDAVLRRTGKILKSVADTQNGFAARLGGDEFALVAPTDDLNRLELLCNDLLSRTAEPFQVEGERLECRVSIGLSTSTQMATAMTPDIDTLSRVTDFALYASKLNGRNCFTIYDLALEKRFLERRQMLEDLPKAIENGHLEVFLQPKVQLVDGRTYGFEALVRWRRNGEIINPAEFIMLAEESGLVVDIDKYVLNAAAKLVADFNTRHATEFSVSVNLSAIHFNSRRIQKFVEHALWRSDIRPDLLTLEITETTEMRDWAEANAIINALHGLGCKISIDDFGTGFSSLAYLRAMVADELKIDRSLVQEIETSRKARLMLSSVFEIARNLDLDIVVEGIESDVQAEVARRLGAQKAQGYWFGRPDFAEKALQTALEAQVPSMRQSIV